ncbi:MAG TPA: hypothetical protein VLY24_18970 [Bryobacteraceae bacterium]|nr:hypothetical protein [Bryobacteraceae bacterium]
MLLLPQISHATCTLASFSGAFSYTIMGTSDGQPLVINGTLAADGAGNLADSNVVTRPFPPLVVNADVGTYQINSDCTGSLIFHFSSEIVHFDFSLANGNTQFFAVCSDPATELSGFASM